MVDKLKDISGLENEFKTWCIRSVSESSADSYWNRIKDFQFFTLEKYTQSKIIGMLNKQIQTQEEKTAISQYIQFLYESYEVDDVDDSDYADLKIKKNSIQSNIDLPKESTSKRKQVDVKRHYIHKDDLIQLLERLETERAMMCYLLYCGQFRIGDLKRLTTAHLREDYGENGAIKVPGRKTSTGFKSKSERTVKFQTPKPIQILKQAPKGEWKDKHGIKWEKVFFPNQYTQLLNYHLKKKCEKLGLTPRTSHSFRHTRTTDLLKNNWSQKKVQMRMGQEIGSTVINDYTETSFDRPPKTLEKHLENKEIEIEEIIT